jgi:hypothetical protein
MDMMDRSAELSIQYLKVAEATSSDDPSVKTAKRMKQTRTKKQVAKQLDNAKGKYRGARNSWLALKKQYKKLSEELEKAKEDFASARTEMLKLNDVNKNMDLVDSNKAVFYENDCVDVSYIIDGEEYCLDAGMDDDDMIPIKEYRRQYKEKAADDASKADDCSSDEDEEPEEDEDVEDVNDSNDTMEIEVPNLRFSDGAMIE